MHLITAVRRLLRPLTVDESSALNKFVVDFRFVAPLPNESDSNETAVENRDQLSEFSRSLVLGTGGGVLEMSVYQRI